MVSVYVFKNSGRYLVDCSLLRCNAVEVALGGISHLDFQGRNK